MASSSSSSSSSQPVPLLRHHPQHRTSAFPAAAAKLPLTMPTKSPSLPRLLCSSRTPPPASTSSTSSSASLSNQLRVLSDTLLRDTSSSSSSTSPRRSRSTWVNPTKPRPSPLSLRRHRRSSIVTLPSGRRLSHAISSLPLPSSPSDFDAALRDLLPDPPDREIALSLLKSVRPWQHTYRLFRWLQSLQGFQVETFFYNLVMKSLRIGCQYHLVEELAQEMVSQDVEMDNITYSTVITCAKRRGDFDGAVGWFERMYEKGPMPDEVTYSALLDVYAHSGRVEDVLSFFERGRACGWVPDSVALAVIAKSFGERGDPDGIKYVLAEMKNLGVKPNLILCNTLVEASCKSGAPAIARDIFKEMVHQGLAPDSRILTALIKTYAKANWKKDALDLWEQIKKNNWPVDLFSYNALLSMCADFGLEEEAEILFAEMKSLGLENLKPDGWSYTALMNIYANEGKVDKAMELFREMLEHRLQPNVMTCTCMIRCLGKLGKIDEVANLFNGLIKGGIKPDDRLSCSLLAILGSCKVADKGKILKCLEVANPRLASFVGMLADDEVSLEEVKEEFRAILNATAMESRKPLTNCLIDVCHNHKFPPRRTRELFRLATMHGLYSDLHGAASNSLHLKHLSFGAALVAFERWMRKLSDDLKSGGDALPPSLFVHTGAGTHRHSYGLADAVASHFADLSVPFRRSETNPGCFVAAKEELLPWLQARSNPSPAAAGSSFNHRFASNGGAIAATSSDPML